MYRPASTSPFFNTPSRKKRVVWADFRRKSAQRVLRETNVTTPGYIPRGRGTREDGRRAFGNRARVVGLACSPTMQTPSPTTKLLAGIASEAAAERVFSAQPVVQETESAGTDLKDDAYGGLLLKATPPKKSVRSPGLLDNAKLGHVQQWLKDEDSESEEESPVLSANTKAWVEDSFVEGQPRSFTGRSRKIAKTFDLTGEPASKRASGSALFASPPPTNRRFDYLDSGALDWGAGGDED